uniref:Uncharacterized protein n=1 Tax=Arundo donax TaxID=35708 RepID=A0A0A9CQP0_ARUDO
MSDLNDMSARWSVVLFVEVPEMDTEARAMEPAEDARKTKVNKSDLRDSTIAANGAWLLGRLVVCVCFSIRQLEVLLIIYLEGAHATGFNYKTLNNK